MQLLTAAQEALLTGNRLEVDFGADLLDLDRVFIEDISDDLTDADVAWRGYARIHRTCKLSLSREVEWGAQLVRLWMRLADGGLEGTFYTGVFSLVTPERPVGEDPTTFHVQGMDRLYLLDRQVGDSYEVASGTGYLAAVRQAIADAGLTGVLLAGDAEAATLPSTRVWPLLPVEGQPTTWLRIVNDLLAAVNYRGVYADELGWFRSEPYVEPSARPYEFRMSGHVEDDDRIVGDDQTVVEDLWGVPNRWIFVQSNRDPADPPTVGDGVYVVDNVSTGKSSQDSRGGLIFPAQFDYEAADHATLEALGDRRVAHDLRRTASIEATTGPFPAAGHFDVFRWRMPDGAVEKVQASSWRFGLAGSDVEWSLEVVV